MSKYYWVCCYVREEYTDTLLEASTRKEAIREADRDFSYLTEADKKHYDYFELYEASMTDDGFMDLNDARMIKSYI